MSNSQSIPTSKLTPRTGMIYGVTEADMLKGEQEQKFSDINFSVS
jgi:hypothetical protein